MRNGDCQVQSSVAGRDKEAKENKYIGEKKRRKRNERKDKIETKRIKKGHKGLSRSRRKKTLPRFSACIFYRRPMINYVASLSFFFLKLYVTISTDGTLRLPWLHDA